MPVLINLEAVRTFNFTLNTTTNCPERVCDDQPFMDAVVPFGTEVYIRCDITGDKGLKMIWWVMDGADLAVFQNESTGVTTTDSLKEYVCLPFVCPLFV